MLPSIVFPYHDPNGRLLLHLNAILPDLKAHFGRAYICPPPGTRQNAAIMAQLETDPFFTIFPVERQLKIGEHFKHLYLSAALSAEPDEMLHLAYVDRLSFALEGSHREQFLADVDALTLEDLPEKIRQGGETTGRGKGRAAPDEGISFQTAVSEFEKALIVNALEKSNWVKNRAAGLLKIKRTTLVEKIKRYRLEKSGGDS